MQLYMYISIIVVLFSTTTLFIIFQRKNLKDLRYRIGLGLSAVLACTGSLLFPGLVTVFSANPALRFFIALFLSFMVYILVLFLVLILVSLIFTKEKMDNLVKRWEEKKQKNQLVAEATGSVPVGADINDGVSAVCLPQPGTESTAMQESPALEPSLELPGNEQAENGTGVEAEDKIDEGSDLIDNAVVSLANSLENNENGEKIVDTSDIIDKMGIGVVTETDPISDQQGQSLVEIIDKAFLLKQQGDIIEAATLYMTALDKQPDQDTAFWIVLDICAIYKITGHADLAEDILLTYIDAFEHLMSEEVKDQILQCLYES